MSLIYFMRRADGVGTIKIGCSKVPAQRLKAHQVWAPELLEIVATAPGTFADEQRIHRQFAEYRAHGEWFEASRPVLALLARVVATGELPPPSRNDKYIQIEEMYRGGMTLAAIGSRLGVSRERIRQILRKSGVPSLGARPEHFRKTVTPAIEAKIVQLGMRGMTRADIARELSVHPQSVGQYLRKASVNPPRGKPQCRASTIDLAFKVATDYRAGLKTAEIAEKHDIDAPHIFRLIRIAGVNPNRVRKPSDLPKGEIVELYKQGQTAKDLAERFGIGLSHLKSIIHASGVRRTREENEAIRLSKVRAANARRKAAA